MIAIGANASPKWLSRLRVDLKLRTGGKHSNRKYFSSTSADFLDLDIISVDPLHGAQGVYFSIDFSSSIELR